MLEADEGDSDSDSDSEDEVSRELMDEQDEGGRRADKNDAADWNMDDSTTSKLLSFDIYLKGNVSKATSFFKTLGQSQRFRTFPYVEKKRKVDEYGEIIDVSMWMQKGKILEEQAESDELKDYRKRQAEEDAKVGLIYAKIIQRLHTIPHRKRSKNRHPSLSPLRLKYSWLVACFLSTWKVSMTVVR